MAPSVTAWEPTWPTTSLRFSFSEAAFLMDVVPPACQQDSLTKAGVKRGLGLPGGSISGIHPPRGEEEEGLMHRGSMCVPCHQLLCLPMQSHREGFRHKRCTTIQCNQCEELISLITNAIPLRRLQTEKIHHQSMQKTRMTDLASHWEGFRQTRCTAIHCNPQQELNTALTFLSAAPALSIAMSDPLAPERDGCEWWNRCGFWIWREMKRPLAVVTLLFVQVSGLRKKETTYTYRVYYVRWDGHWVAVDALHGHSFSWLLTAGFII